VSRNPLVSHYLNLAFQLKRTKVPKETKRLRETARLNNLKRICDNDDQLTECDVPDNNDKVTTSEERFFTLVLRK
jgi:hypothetical protein